jgi:electron transfer flavoprotein beta subunit
VLERPTEAGERKNNDNIAIEVVMRIIVCVKQIRLIYARTSLDPEQHFIGPEDCVFRINPYDEAALELALKIKDQKDDAEIILLTLGPIIAETELRRCMALGADDVYQIETEEELDPWSKSKLLARASKDMNPDLILCGKESLDKQNGQVGAFVAHHMDLPFLSAALVGTLQDNDTIEVRRAAGRGMREVIACPLPAVLSVDLGSHEPRLPIYEDKKRTRSMEIKRLSYPDEVPASKTMSVRVFPPRPRPKETPAPDSKADAFYRVEQLLAGSRIQKKGIILDGHPESQVQGIISYLKEHGFIESKRIQKRNK